MKLSDTEIVACSIRVDLIISIAMETKECTISVLPRIF